jgi:hypothetical protein
MNIDLINMYEFDLKQFLCTKYLMKCNVQYFTINTQWNSLLALMYVRVSAVEQYVQF